MIRSLFFSVLFLFAINVIGQFQYMDEYTVRDSLISEAMSSEEYDLAIGLINQQIDLIEAYEIYDSLYHYCYNFGRANWKAHNAEKGIDVAIDISTKVKERDDDVLHYLQTLNDLSWLYYETGKVSECLSNDSIYLVICLENDSIPTDIISIAYYNLGFDYMEFGKYAKALDQFQKSADVILASNDSLDDRLSMSYNALGAMQWRLGENDEARKSYEKSLKLLERYTDPKSQLEKGNILGNIALILQDNGQIIQSKEYQESMLRIDAEALPLIDDPYWRETALRRMSSAYINLADIYFSLGDYANSRKLIELAIKERKELLEPDDPSLASAIEHLAYLEMQSGNYKEAEIKLLEYLAYCKKYFGDQSAMTAWALKGLGTLYSLMGDYKLSEKYFNEAIKNQKAAGNPKSDPALALIYRERSALYAKTNQPKMALSDLHKSFRIYSKSREESNKTFVGIYLEMAEVRMENADLPGALKDVESALSIIEENENLAQQSPYLIPKAFYLKALLTVNNDSSTSALIKAVNELEIAIEFLRTNKIAFLDQESKLLFYESHKKIFNLAEDLVYSLYGQTDDGKWLEIFFQITEENRTILLRNRLQIFSALDYAGIPDSVLQLERKLTAKLYNEKEDPQATKDIVDIERQYDALMLLVQQQYPEYYSLKYDARPMTFSDVRENLLGMNSSLLIYSVTEKSVYALLIEQEGEELFKLSKEDLKSNIVQLSDALVERDNPSSDMVAEKLYKQFFAPIQQSISNETIFIVPDEDLFFLNFEILPNLKQENAKSEKEMLIHDYTISYFLSTTVALQFRHLSKNNTERVLTVAPGFTDRLKTDYKNSVDDSTLVDQKYLTYIQQPFAVKTARQIAGVFSGAAFIENEANETTFKQESGKYGIIHLGTHAEVDENAPMMSHLVLSKNINNDSLDDGYLYAYEIYQMPMHAELAVLTACETGIGKQQNSEGVISLAHSFTYAGCPSIVMSLWSIDEKTSAGIISDFYEYLSKGLQKNDALRKAKLDYLRNAPTELQSPYYWAGLVLLGDESSVNITPTKQWGKPFLVILVLSLVLVAILRGKRKSSS